MSQNDVLDGKAHAHAGDVQKHIFYIHGYDPRGPAIYYRYFQEAATHFATREGRDLTLTRRTKTSPVSDGWTMAAHRDGQSTRIQYEVLRWDDAVRKIWARQPRAGLPLGALRIWHKFRQNGILAVLHKEARASYRSIVVQGLFAPLFAIGLLALVGVVFLLGFGLAKLFHLPDWSLWVLPLLTLAIAWPVWRALQKWLNLAWVTRGLSFVSQFSRGDIHAPQAHWRAFGERIWAIQQADNCDEIIVVAHSLGALMAVRALGHWRQLAKADGKTRRPLKFVTLGQSLPLYTLQKSDDEFACVLAEIAACADIEWLDVTSGSDPASSCGLNPLAGLPGEPTLQRQSPDFHNTLSPEHFRKIRARPIDFHFQYLKATDSAEGFDYLRMICAPVVRKMDHPA
ncbi:MAG: hypothetical protein KGJ29_02300 [Hyphomicrobiales bacterium]|nr:hypothetical protein [Hyphomicrobiales bacterium]